ncbi:MAG: GNAT family N-acetyltransferase, partial [Bdellovibrionales bacterium]|nr:GNAT family N-acetyltransferase [Bdellovibrionales bacterium]
MTQPMSTQPSPKPSDEASRVADEFSVRASNRDNRPEAEQIADLFFKHYGANFPVPSVYDPNFWSARDVECREEQPAERLTSIVAVHGERVIGHIALRRTRGSDEIELMYPALHPAYRRQLFSLSRRFWRCVTDIGSRQGWTLAFHYSLLSHPMWQLVANKCFSSVEMAVLPNSSKQGFVLGPCQSSRSPLLVMINTFPEASRNAKRLHCPEHHRKFIEKLYRPLGLMRDFSSSPVRGVRANGVPAPLISPRVIHKEGFGLYRLLLTPHDDLTPAMIERALSELSEEKLRRTCIEVSLEHAACPLVAGLVESMGFRMSGVLPGIEGRDSLLYALYDDSDLADLTLYSARAKYIRGYCLSAGGDTAASSR